MATAKATVILLPGGDGWLAIAGGQPTRLTGNFLVRTRQGLHGMGFRTVLATAAAFNMMAASVDVSFAEINGGIANDPDPCQGGALHGFARAGAPALDAIKKWILTLKR